MTFKEYIEKNNITDFTITTLDINNYSLSDLKGIESFKDLRHLICYNNKLTDLKGIESLINLKKLSCSNNQITSLKGIENLTDLEVLYCSFNQITSLKPIVRLKKLILLISDITDNIGEARQLIKTELRKDKISDID